MMLKAHQKFQLNHNQIYIIVHRSWLKMNSESISKSSPSQVAILIFLAKTEKTFSNSSPSQVAIYAKFGKKSLRPRIYARSYLRRIRPYQKRWKDIKIILFLSNPDVSFYEVEEHKHNFVSLSGS